MGSSKIMAGSLDDSVFDGVAMQSTSEEILGKVNNLNNTLNVGVTATCIKSVQRIITTLTSDSTTTTCALSALM